MGNCDSVTEARNNMRLAKKKEVSNSQPVSKNSAPTSRGITPSSNQSSQRNSLESFRVRRRSIKENTLIQKSKMFQGVFKDELCVPVKQQFYIEERYELPTEKYNLISKLGEGSFGTVYDAKNKITQTEVAIKKINKTSLNQVDGLDLANEANILKSLSHPNILKIFEFYNTPSSYYIVNEKCHYGELFRLIRHNFTEEEISVIMYQVLSGLTYLHDRNIIHRDLKWENILISDFDTNEDKTEKYCWVKWIDFGAAKMFNKSKNEKAVVGTCYYIAPEVWNRNYDNKCDSWSAGVILYMLATNRAPFDGKTDQQINKSTMRGVYDKNHYKLLSKSNELRDWISRLLEYNPEKRISAKDALNHPFFTKFNPKIIYQTLERTQKEKLINNLLNYKLNSKFQQIAFAFLCHNIEQTNETKDILKLFMSFNTSSNGKLTKSELKASLQDFIDYSELDTIIDDLFVSLDGSNNGYIEYEEFLCACLSKETILKDDHLKYAFDYFVKKNEKCITINELKSIFRHEAANNVDQICQNIINNIDINNDGIIDYSEFKKMIESAY